MSRQAGIYLRISSDPSGTRLGVTRQRTDCATKAKARGWTVAEVFEDNDVSASTGKRRPAYERMLDAIRAGRINAVVVWDLDRLTRRPIEIEQFIELADRHGVELASVGGDVDLSTDAGRLVARIMGAVARNEVDHKARRQKAANQQRREMGIPHTCSRGYGYTADGMTMIEDEAAVIRAAAAELLAGHSVRGLAAALNRQGIPTAAGGRWQSTTLRKMLLRPRLASLVAYRGELTGTAGSWPAILDVETYHALTALLSDPSRRAPGRPRSYLLSGIASCAMCSLRLSGGFEKLKGYPVYRCPNRQHVCRRGAEIDDYVTDLLLTRLADPAAADLFTEPERADDTRALHDEARGVRSRLDGLAEAFAAGDIDREQLTVGTRRLNARLEVITAHLGSLGSAPGELYVLAGTTDIEAVWNGLEMERRRAVVRSLLASVAVHGPGRGARRFDPATVTIQWKSSPQSQAKLRAVRPVGSESLSAGLIPSGAAR